VSCIVLLLISGHRITVNKGQNWSNVAGRQARLSKWAISALFVIHTGLLTRITDQPPCLTQNLQVSYLVKVKYKQEVATMQCQEPANQ